MDAPLPPADETLDCEGLLCPLPVLRARKRLAGLAPGTVLAVRATDAMARIDLPHFCAGAGHVYLGVTEEGGGVAVHLIRRGGGPA
jgi:tRNA 2-thiouridine synthesizing protein A